MGSLTKIVITSLTTGGYDLYVVMTEHDTSTFKEEILREQDSKGEGLIERGFDVATSADLGVGTSIATTATISGQMIHTRIPNFNKVLLLNHLLFS